MKSSSITKYYVQVGAYAQKENAERQLQKAKDAAFSDSFMRVVAQTNSQRGARAGDVAVHDRTGQVAGTLV